MTGTLIPLWRLSIDLARNVANGRAQVFVKPQVNGAPRRTPLPFVRIQGLLRRTAKKRSGQGVQLHLDPLDTAEPFPGISPLELSNNLAENSMRPVALGRRNWIHIGSEQAGPRVAAIVSVVETCRRLKIPIRDYLCSILPGLANFPINRIGARRPPLGWPQTNRQYPSRSRPTLTVR